MVLLSDKNIASNRLTWVINATNQASNFFIGTILKGIFVFHDSKSKEVYLLINIEVVFH